MKNPPQFLASFLPHVQQAILDTEKKNDECSLYMGDLSNAVYWAYLYKVTGKDEHFAKVDAILSDHMDRLSEYVYNYKFAYGIPGFAWFIQFLVNNGILDNQEFLTDLDDHIEKSLRWNFEDKHYDLFTGYIGKALYFVERYEYTKSEYHKAILAKVVEEIQHSAVSLNEGKHTAWLDTYTSYYVKFRDGEPFYGFGISHGISSLIYFLAVCSDLDINKSLADSMLRQAVDYVMDNEVAAPDYFPDRLYGDGFYTKVHTLSWCYGVLSVSIALYAAAKVLQDQNLLDRVHEIVVSSAQHYTLQNAKLGLSAPECPNIFFCHGTAGIGHIFHQFGKVYNDSTLKAKGDYWLLQTTDYIQKFPWTNREIYSKTGLLEGPAGIGTVLLDRIYNTDGFNWNKMFMTDIDRF